MKIWNKKNICPYALRDSFESGATLGDLAKQHNCAPVTIKRKLRSIGVDTSIHNNSEIAKQRQRDKVCTKTSILTKDFLYKKLIMENLDTKTLSEQLGIHYSVIRARSKKFGIKKNKDQLVGAWQSRYKEKNGYFHPTQDPKHSHKYCHALNHVKYKAKSDHKYLFKSIIELTYALWLDYNNRDWNYKAIRVPYIDHITGKRRIYVVDFNMDNEWIEVKPQESMIPHDKRLYAERLAHMEGCKFRGIYKDELKACWGLLESEYRVKHYDFIRNPPKKNSKQVSYYFKDNKEMQKFKLNGYRIHFKKQLASNVHKLVLRREKLF